MSSAVSSLSRSRSRALFSVAGVLATAGAVTALAASSAGAHAVPHAGAAQLTTCATSSLKVSLGRQNATAGTIYYPLKFVNRGKTTCAMRGYPGVSAVTKSGKQIGNAAKRSGNKFRTVTVAPGKQQSSTVGIIETGNFSKARCKPVKAAGLKVFPPNQRKAVILKKKFSTCSSRASTSLVVRPVK